MYLILLSRSNGCLKVRILKVNCLKMVYSLLFGVVFSCFHRQKINFSIFFLHCSVCNKKLLWKKVIFFLTIVKKKILSKIGYHSWFFGRKSWGFKNQLYIELGNFSYLRRRQHLKQTEHRVQFRNWLIGKTNFCDRYQYNR